jgi:hypothetical protein
MKRLSGLSTKRHAGAVLANASRTLSMKAFPAVLLLCKNTHVSMLVTLSLGTDEFHCHICRNSPWHAQRRVPCHNPLYHLFSADTVGMPVFRNAPDDPFEAMTITEKHA